MKEITIIVAGQAGSGKSTIALMIEKFLIERDFTVEMNMTLEMRDYETEQKFRQLYGINMNEREEALMKKGTKIILKQMPMKHVTEEVNENYKDKVKAN